MRISHVLAFAAASLSGAAFADSTAPAAGAVPSSQSATTVLVNAATHSLYKLTPAEAQGMAGSFQLEDGRLLVLTSKRSKVYAEFDGKREELVPLGENRFVSRDTGAELHFDQVPFGMTVTMNQAKP